MEILTSFSKILLVALLLKGLIIVNGEEAKQTFPSNPILLGDDYDASELDNKTPAQLAEMRGFGTQVHHVRTPDAYHLEVVRVVNPKIDQKNLKRPVIFNHGFLECASLWFLNSRHNQPLPLGKLCQSPKFNETLYKSGPILLSNMGYDVWVMSMRGTDHSQIHDFLDPKQDEFWDYSLDDFALTDVPTVINYVRRLTQSPKVGYIGHSQATFALFGLLATRPSYNEIIEPAVAIAPVAFFDHISSALRPIVLAKLESPDMNSNGPFPNNAKLMRTFSFHMCTGAFNQWWCQLIQEMISGKGKLWKKGYYGQMIFSSSLKVVRHFGQLIKGKRFAMYDYGPEENLKIYGRKESPSYPIEKIRSKSLCLFYAKADTISAVEDITRFRERLKVRPFKTVFVDQDFNHMDLVLDDKSAEYVYKPILETLEHFERKNGVCKRVKPKLTSNKFISKGVKELKNIRNN